MYCIKSNELTHEVENAAYAGICAERTALVKAITSREDHPRTFRAIGVAADTSEPCSPCGSIVSPGYIDR